MQRTPLLIMMFIHGCSIFFAPDPDRLLEDNDLFCSDNIDNDLNNLIDCEEQSCDVFCAVCGDGILLGLEECDDNNLTNGDGCDSNCQLSSCGDGLLQIAQQEECDDGNGVDRDGCDAQCKLNGDSACGDDILAINEVCHSAPNNIVAGNNPESIVVVDMDADGLLDIVLTNETSDNIGLFFGRGDGTFDALIDLTVGDNPEGLAAADFDGDGDLDLAINIATPAVALVFQSPGRNFALGPEVFPVDVTPKGLVSVDLNNDQKPDLITANQEADNISVLLGNGDGTFLPQSAFSCGVDSRPAGIFAADVDNDGNADIVSANTSNQTLSLFFGDGSGGLPTMVVIAAGRETFRVAVADINHDGRLDLLSSNQGDDNVGLHLQDPNGAFAPLAPVLTTLGPIGLIAEDLDLDGLLDIAVVGETSDSVSLLIQGDQLSFDLTPITVGDGPESIGAGDFNRDGKPDLVVTSQFGDNISVLLSAP